MPFLALELPRFLTFDMDQLGKHRRHHWKKRLKINRIGNFESDTSSASEDITPQVAKFYRGLCGGGRFVAWGGGGGVCFCLPPPPPPPHLHHTNLCKTSQL